MRNAFLFLSLVALGGSAIRAEDAAAPEPAAPVEEMAEVTRDPFWPVGYTPRNEAPVSAASGDEAPKAGLQMNNLTAEQQVALARKLRISGIMKTGSSYLARLNNQLVGEGDEIAIDFNGQPLTLIVRSISQDSVQIEPKQ